MIALTIVLVVSIAFVIFFNALWPFSTDTTLYKCFFILSNISYSYIVSFVFYTIVWIPERRNKKTINKYILKHSHKIASEIFGMVKSLVRTSGIDQINESTIKTMCSKINPHSNSGVYTRRYVKNGIIDSVPLKWAEYVMYHKNRMMESFEELKRFSFVMDAELFEIITKIQDSTFVMVVDGFLGNISNCANQDLTAMQDQFIEIWKLYQELTSYHKTK